MTSGHSNSEIYLVGKGFRGIPDNIRRVLSIRLETFTPGPLIDADAIKKDVMSVMLTTAKQLTQLQIDTIRLGIDMYEAVVGPLQNRPVDERMPAIDKLLADIQPAQVAFSVSWTKIFPIRRIDIADYVSAIKQ